MKHLMLSNSGVKAIDNLITKYTVGYSDISNVFQKALVLPPCDSHIEARNAIKSFGLKRFPPAIWLKLINHCQQQPTVLHQFKLPQLDGQVFCWVLLSEDGILLELVSCIHKSHYEKASKYLAKQLTQHADAPQHFELAYG
ncbi:hypothetical protein QX776_03845 [Alteromonadaceae bacterium BrNp21-10]|nr:hypothetical protein [Alteromonadaceae bacterium BrNp21-10]